MTSQAGAMISATDLRAEGAAMADTDDEQSPGDGVRPGPRSRLMEEVADQMDAIEADFGDDFQIGAVVTIVEVSRSDGTTGIRVRNNSPLWVGLGMLKVAEKALEVQADG
jgi:hypothetical protein